MRDKETYRYFEEDASRLLDALARGKDEAISYLFDTRARSLWFYCNEILRDGALAEDVVQEVFVRLWESRKRFPDLLSVHAFLYRVGRNLSLDLLRHRVVRRRHEPAIIRELNENVPDGKLIEEELLGELHRAVDRLPAACARVFRLSLAGAGNQEIADRLSISIHTVKTQKHRALVALKDWLGGARDG
ncbi:MAG: sigma-70 family RNA polymerase sigma factor [Odoribacteraceae bacterium]|jgi:RNA polymerase sigma-70 factor (ECF subfamily)|nr:sigma-70 family RNA polymerase sigma factor [Odoribacteraceae bacterium]